jgi:hypothetical protein
MLVLFSCIGNLLRRKTSLKNHPDIFDYPADDYKLIRHFNDKVNSLFHNNPPEEH